jgi:hypothetical protein
MKKIKPNKIILLISGAIALVWFLVRVVPKPSRACYPCQKVAFPVASAFVVWLAGLLANMFVLSKLKSRAVQNRFLLLCCSAVTIVAIVFWFSIIPSSVNSSLAGSISDTIFKPAVGFDWKPGESNKPIGAAQGIFPGRVVMVRNPETTKWAGNWKKEEDQWWLDKNTDIDKVSEMLSISLQKITGTKSDKEAWDALFKFYNKNSRGMENRGYDPSEIIAIKFNLNNSGDNKKNNQVDASPQLVLSMVRQLVNIMNVPQKNILIYDAKRPIYPAMLLEVWKEFKDVRFLQENPATDVQPVNPAYGDRRTLESADWVEAISYSAGDYHDAKLIPRQVKEATYLINFAVFKLHSYPYNYMEDGDEGQTALTMTGKNHAGSIKGPGDLHAILNTKKEGTKNAYSPLVDLAASPNLGAKTILYLMDGLYCGRKYRSYPLHFPNPPFNNKTTPYENPEWPACVLVSLDGVAIQSVGMDIMYAQSKNNNEPTYHNVPRILIRDNADDFLREMATPESAPSGTKYIQSGKPVKSLGVFEHWDNDLTMRYSRNIDPKNGKGIEFIYIPVN